MVVVAWASLAMAASARDWPSGCRVSVFVERVMGDNVSHELLMRYLQFCYDRRRSGAGHVWHRYWQTP